MNVQSTRIYSDRYQGKPVQRFDTNGNHRADANEPMLVQRQGDGWVPADVQSGVDRHKLEDKYGVWTDRQISHKEGWFWNKKEVIDRPKDNAIQEDEVQTFGFTRTGNGINGPNRYELGAEIVADQNGGLVLDEHSITFGARYIVGQGDIRRMEDYRSDGSNWQTRPEPVLIGSAEGPFIIGSGPTTITIPISMGK